MTPRPASWLAAVVIVCVVLMACRPGPSARGQNFSGASVRVHWRRELSDTNRFVLEVVGLDMAALRQFQDRKPVPWPRLLAAYADTGDVRVDVELPPMVGTYRVQSGILRFEPGYPLQPGIQYRAVLHPDQLPGGRSSLVTATFKLPAQFSNPGTVVSRIYPSTEVLPENLLKFYVQFSGPMQRGHIYEHIHLRNASGRDVDLPFLEIDEELWNPSRTRLTLFIDPGRIKRGVRPLEEVGSALQEGQRYKLVIDSAWRDGAGSPLRETFQKEFRVGPANREAIDPTQWRIDPPKKGTRAALQLTFPKPMDHALAQRLILVADPAGRLMVGDIGLGDEERQWSFIPSQSWRGGHYQLVVQTTLEDLAGNNVGKPFEVDLLEPVQQRLSNSSVRVPFEVR